jgi:flagellar biogenesis protein FliO
MTSLRTLPKWLLLPPAVALLLLLGPLSMQGSQQQTTEPLPAANAPLARALGAPEEETPRVPRPALPKTPDLWQMVSAVAGILLLGAGGILVLRRLRGPAPARSAAPLLTLRQTLRVSARQAVHAIEFDDRILLVGEHERGLTLIDGGRLHNSAKDAAEIAGRLDEVVDDGDDEGAVPKNLVIPRPPNAAARLREARAGARSPSLTDFRSLLTKAGR